MGSSVRNIATIAGKEARSYFNSPVAWVVFGLFALLFGYFYYVYVYSFVQESMGGAMGGPEAVNINLRMIRPLLQNASILILFILPMVTMRIYSEEKRSGTIELLLTSPLKDVEIVLGKFLGAMAMYAGLLGVSAIYIVVLFFFGSPAVLPLLSGYLGLLLMGSGFVAIGLFLSTLTANQMVAGASSFVVFLLLWIISWIGDSFGGTARDVLQYLSLTYHFDDFGKGVIELKHVVYYLSFVVFGLFLATKSVDSDRWRG